jgi:hypothetical protein
MPFGYLSIAEALAVFEAQPVSRLRETVVLFEDYILYMAQKRRWEAEIQSLEATVSVIKSVLGRRGAFD